MKEIGQNLINKILYIGKLYNDSFRDTYTPFEKISKNQLTLTKSLE